MLDKLRNRIASASRDGSLQQKVDAVSSAYHRARDSEIASGLGEKSRAVADSVGSAPGDALASLFPRLGHLKGIAGQLQSSGGLLRAVNQITRELPSADRSAAVKRAFNGLSGASREDLAGRLGSQGNDPAAAVIGILDQGGGVEQVLRRLSRGHPATGAFSLIETLRDPAVQEFARSLIPALVKAKSGVIPPPDSAS